MAYDKRKAEVMDLLDDHDFGDTPEKDIELLKRVLTTYFNRRQYHLKEILNVLPLGRTTPSLKVWLDKATAGRRMVHDTFEDVPESTQAWVAPIAKQEFTFFQIIYRCPVAKHRDEMIKQSKALVKAKEEFEDKWEEMIDRDDDLEDKMKRVGEKFEEVLEKAAKDAAKLEKQVKERVADAVKKGVGMIGKATLDLGAVEQVMDVASRALGKYVSEVDARKMEIFVLLSLENQIFASFKQGRKEVEKFLETNGYQEVKDAWEKAEDAIEAIEGKMATSAQKSDAAEYIKAVKSELEKVFKKTETDYKEFAKKHEYLFFGPLGSSWHRQLAESDLWKDFSNNWKDGREDFDDLLRENIFSIRRGEAFDVDLDDITDEQYRDFERRMVKRSRELLAAWNKLKNVAKKASTEMLTGHENQKRVLDSMR